ncbi:hypothetical protein ACHHYP_07493 [Achlya hypogyna]|uniref:Uncharacterized protein n=1 Tax=Achlya hypogyna TaxID=1202772 RepID=A0A1V9ZLT9_ACHHY|nr:hypothetical protein ACHHYP_07493 [Achlya hypogyna]
MQSPLPSSPMMRPLLKLPPRQAPSSPLPPPRATVTAVFETPSSVAAPRIDLSQTSTWLRDDDAIMQAYDRARRIDQKPTPVLRPAAPKIDMAALHRQCVDAIARYTKRVEERRVQMERLKLYSIPKAPFYHAAMTFQTPEPSRRRTPPSASPLRTASTIESCSPDDYHHVQKTLDFTDSQPASPDSMLKTPIEGRRASCDPCVSETPETPDAIHL